MTLESEYEHMQKNTKSKFYVGRQQFEYSYISSPVQLIQVYVQSIMNIAYGFTSQLDNEWDENTFKHKASEIIICLFQSILRHHNIILPYEMKVYQQKRNVCLGEALFYKIHGKCLNIFINQEIIENVLENKADPILTFSKEIEYADSWSKPQCGNRFLYQNLILKLLVIADHAATHFLEEYITGKTDWVNHINFGRQQVTTLASAFQITSNILYNNKVLIKNLAQPRLSEISTSTGNTNFDFNLANIEGSVVDPNSLFTNILE